MYSPAASFCFRNHDAGGDAPLATQPFIQCEWRGGTRGATSLGTTKSFLPALSESCRNPQQKITEALSDTVTTTANYSRAVLALSSKTERKQGKAEK